MVRSNSGTRHSTRSPTSSRGVHPNSASVLESIERVEALLGKKLLRQYTDKNRIGDHICYYSDLDKILKHYPNWSVKRSLDDIFEQFARGED